MWDFAVFFFFTGLGTCSCGNTGSMKREDGYRISLCEGVLLVVLFMTDEFPFGVASFLIKITVVTSNEYFQCPE